VKEGEAADRAVRESERRTMTRRELARHEQFEMVSPELGELDEDAFDEAMGDDPDAAMSMLADLTGATDERLRALARRLAGRIVIDLARDGRVSRRGIGRLATVPYRPGAGDIDLDASLEPIAHARATGGALVADDLRVRDWRRPDIALCLLIDRSGSMTGGPLATSAVACAAIAARVPGDYSVVAFGVDAVVAKSQDAPKSTEQVASAVLALRGFGTTDLALALRTAGEQLARSRATRRVTVLLSDCRATVPGDVVGAARSLDELVIIAPEGDADDAVRLAEQAGARCTTVGGPSSLPEALARVL
jgi:Mg-chelatase subunit ChlD